MPEETKQEIQDKKRTGRRIARCRRGQGLTQEQLAEKLGEPFTGKMISQFENGSDHLRIGPFFKIADILGVTPNELSPERLIPKDQALLYDFHDLSEENQETIRAMIKFLLQRQQSGN